MFKVNNEYTRMTSVTCSSVFIVNVEHGSSLFAVFLMLTLSMF